VKWMSPGWTNRRCGVVLALVMPLMVSGCRSAAKPATTVSNVKSYPVKGVVESVDAKRNRIDLKANAIPGYMEAMTMSYPVADPAAVAEMHPGDLIMATLEVDPEENMSLTGVDIIGQAKPDYLPAMQYHVPAAGDEVPQFKLLNQSDKTIDLKQFRGKVLLVTFVYTRCPLADYCVKMSRNFAKLDKALQADPKLYGETHLLTVSFDPTYDTPKVLKSYGGAYTGRYGQETFTHWDFAAPSEKELPSMEQFFDVGVTPIKADGNNTTLQHSLSTVVIGKDGKVFAFWPSNDWTVDDVMAKVKAAAAA
jgi:protein SCO1/2